MGVIDKETGPPKYCARKKYNLIPMPTKMDTEERIIKENKLNCQNNHLVKSKIPEQMLLMPEVR